MKRTAISLFVCVAIGGWASTVSAAGKRRKAHAPAPAAAETTKTDSGPAESAAPASAASDNAAPAPSDAGDSGSSSAGTGSESVDVDEKPEKVDDTAVSSGAGAPSKTPALAAGDATAAWKDILVIPRKPFLKDKRLEFAPFTGASINDILIRHYTFGFDLNFFLTDVFSIGVQGQYFIKNLTEREQLVGLQYNRIPTLNRYLYGGALNFGYVPVYGKFALFNSRIISWEIFVSAGVGIVRTEMIPRNPSNSSIGTNALAPNFAVGGRLFLNNWLTLNWTLRDYVINDRFENSARAPNEGPNTAAHPLRKAWANNTMLTVGLGLYLPTGFQYKQPR